MAVARALNDTRIFTAAAAELPDQLLAGADRSALWTARRTTLPRPTTADREYAERCGCGCGDDGSRLIAVELFGRHNHRRDFVETIDAQRAKEAVAVPGVASHAKLIDLQQNRIAIAVDQELNQLLGLARGLTFPPQLLARA